MRKVKWNVNVPFQILDYEVQYARLKPMDELESLLMIAIVTLENTGSSKKQTLESTLESVFNIRPHTLPIIEGSLDSLIKSKTISLEGIETGADLLDKKTRRIRAAIDKDIQNRIINKKQFVKKDIKYRTMRERIIENVIVGIKKEWIVNVKENVKYDEKWKVVKLPEEAMENTVDIKISKDMKSDEVVHKKKYDKTGSKIIYYLVPLELEIKDWNIYPSNEFSKIYFEEIKKNNLSSSSLAYSLNTKYFTNHAAESKALSNKNHVLPVKNEEGKMISDNINVIYLENHIGGIAVEHEHAYELFIKKNIYSIKEISKEIEVFELYGQQISVESLADLLIIDKNAKYINQFQKIRGLKEYILKKKTTVANKKYFSLMKFFLKNYTPFQIITMYSDKLKLVHTKESILSFLKKQKKQEILKYKKEISLISDIFNNDQDIYRIAYNNALVKYTEGTELFPNWDAEINHKSFLENLNELKSKLPLIETKKEAEKLLATISKKFDFAPINSEPYSMFINNLRSKITAFSESEIREHASKLRFMLENLVNKRGSKDRLTFSQLLDKAISDQKISNKDDTRKLILHIYKFSNKFHHDENIKYDKGLEKKIKEKIKAIYEIYVKNGVEFKYQEELKWAES